MPKQNQIIAAVAAVIETVSPAAGYTVDLAGKVFIEHQKALPESLALFVVVSRGEKAIPEGAEYGHNRRELEIDITVQGKGKADNVENNVRNAADDIDLALAADSKLGGLARWVTLEHSRPVFEEAADMVIAQQLTISVGFIEN